MRKFVGLAFVFLLFLGACQQPSDGDNQINDNDVILTIVSENDEHTLTLTEIINNYTKVDFQANIKSSGNDPVLTDFGGVKLKEILTDLNIDLDNQQVVFKSEDGYQTMVSAQDVLMDDNVYVVFERNFERTTSADQGGSGPLEIVIAQDPFSQRWNKHLIEIEITP